MSVEKDSSTPVRLAVIGCGAITRASHLPSLARLPEFQVKVLCDTNRRNASLMRAEFDLDSDIASDVSELEGRVDAAIVATPPRFHAPIALQLMRMGIDVMCEKPLAATVAEAEQMVEVADRLSRILAVGLVTRLHPNNEILLDVLADDLLGDIQHISVEFGGQLDWPMTSDAYFRPSTSAGGVLFDAGVHFIDRMAWLFGDLSDITMWDDSYGGFEANALMSGTLTVNGRAVPCSSAFSWTHQLSNSICVTGSHAQAEVRMSDPNHVWMKRKIGGKNRIMSISSGMETSMRTLDPYCSQLADFAAAVRTRQLPFVPGSTAVTALRIIERAYSVRQRIAQPWVETAS
jgi:predicted dehydrogenase